MVRVPDKGGKHVIVVDAKARAAREPSVKGNFLNETIAIAIARTGA